VLDIACIETIVPAPSFTSGFVFGKLVSFAIGKKPPTSSTRSITLALIAAVVAIKSSLLDQDWPELINSDVSLFKNLVSSVQNLYYHLQF